MKFGHIRNQTRSVSKGTIKDEKNFIKTKQSKKTDLVSYLTFPESEPLPKGVQFNNQKEEVTLWRLDTRKDLHVHGMQSWGVNGSALAHFLQVQLLSTKSKSDTRFISTTEDFNGVKTLFSRTDVQLNSPIYLYEICIKRKEYNQLLNSVNILKYGQTYLSNIGLEIEKTKSKLKTQKKDCDELQNDINVLKALKGTGEIFLKELSGQYYKNKHEVLVTDQIKPEHIVNSYALTPVFKRPLYHKDKCETSFKISHEYSKSGLYDYYLNGMKFETM